MTINIQIVKRGVDLVGHSRAEKIDSRERILDAAARQIRQGGLESVSIAELMKAANLTHGGFYGIFRRERRSSPRRWRERWNAGKRPSSPPSPPMDRSR